MNGKSPTPEVILIVDDNPANLELLFNLLDEAGFEVRIARNGESALRKVEYSLPDLILLDVMMPVMDGFETCQQLKANLLTQDIPVIFMTALSETTEKIKGFSLGAVDYITKPFQQAEVIARIKLHLQLRSLTKTLEQKNLLLQERTQQLEDKNEQLQVTLNALQESEERFRCLCAYSPVGIFLTDMEGYCTYTNLTWQAISGLTPEESLGEGWARVLHPQERQKVLENWFMYARGGCEYYDEFRLQNQVGVVRWVQVHASPLILDNGQLIGHIGIVEDITERKQGEEEVRQLLERERELNELKSRFVSLVSHEFRTPLSNVVLSAELLERYDHKLNDEKRGIYFQRIKSATKRMTQLLENVLLTGKAEAGKLEFNPELVDLEKFCSDLVEELQLSITAHSLIFVCPDNCPTAYMDIHLLHYIFSNLLSNAIKYSPQGGIVRFELSIEVGDAIFRVQDAGIGIPKVDLHQLFKPFHRATNAYKIRGTGLGLTIVKHCVDLQGGQISVESEEGVGTTFTVRLPLNTEKAQLYSNNGMSGQGG